MAPVSGEPQITTKEKNNMHIKNDDYSLLWRIASRLYANPEYFKECSELLNLLSRLHDERLEQNKKTYAKIKEKRKENKHYAGH